MEDILESILEGVFEIVVDRIPPPKLKTKRKWILKMFSAVWFILLLSAFCLLAFGVICLVAFLFSLLLKRG
jgi:hypothetical protein